MWDVVIPLNEASKVPLFLQIARYIAAQIQEGALSPGARLPGSRSLAKSLSVHRNTVIAAYDELVSQGWIVQVEASGTFVSEEIPVSAPVEKGEVERAMARVLGFPLPPSSLPAYRLFPPKEIIALAGGMPDLSVFPVAEWSRAYRRCLQRSGHRLLGYGDPMGYGPLRRALAQMLSARRGLPVGPDDLLLTRGSQMALSLVARVLIRPGDVVAVEAYGYEPAWTALRMAGAHLVPVDVDGDGLVIEALESLLAHTSIRAIYVTPHHQYPTQAPLSAGRRLRLLELAQARQFAVIEDDYDHEFHYEGRPILPLASADQSGCVVYVGTLSKVLAPGLRLGYVVAPAPLLDAMGRLRRYVDRQGAQIEEAALVELLEEGQIERHVRRMKRLYQRRRDALAAALREQLGDALSFMPPKGGMSLWAAVHNGLREVGGAGPSEGTTPLVVRWQQLSWDEGVSFEHGGSYVFDRRPRPFVRLGFALHDESTLREGVRRMLCAYERL